MTPAGFREQLAFGPCRRRLSSAGEGIPGGGDFTGRGGLGPEGVCHAWVQ